MSKTSNIKKLPECNEDSIEQFLNVLKSLVKEIKEFNSKLIIFIDEKKKEARDLWSLVTRYNILNRELPCVYPIIEKEEMLQELIVKIQENTETIYKSLITIKNHFDKLPKHKKLLQKESDKLDWTSMDNSSIRGSTRHKYPSHYLEEVADIIFHYDIAITCMLQYFDALNLKEPDTYLNWMNSFSISTEVVDLSNEFQINCMHLFS